MKKIKSSVLAVLAISTLTQAHAGINKVSNDSKIVHETIGDKDISLQVLSEAALREAAIKKSIISISDPAAMKVLSSLPQGKASADSIQRKDLHSKGMMKALESIQTEESLLVGFPIGLVGEQNVFGGVITTVTDKDSEMLGGLKLTDLPAIHVRTLITRGSNGLPVLTLVGCFDKCDEASEQQALLSLPIVGFNQEDGQLILDMSIIGKELDLISMLDPNGQYTQLKAISSATTKVEYDMKTLVFDIQTKMIPVTATPTPGMKTTDFTVRWYLKLNSGSNPLFVPRGAAPGVGFFTTERSAETKITRFSITGDGTGAPTVKYYVKNVPDEYKSSFAKALDSWNVEFKNIIGRDLLSYEFVDQDDELASELVAGDVRYNVIEWDLYNKAGYGGLGPSIANQYTGETMSANVLIQGPTVVSLYTKWFGISKKAEELKAQGRTQEANQIMKEFNQSVEKEMKTRTAQKFQVKLGKNLEMIVRSQRADLEDPLAKGDFEIIPAGMTYEKYIDGYFQEMVAHEIGHNLGLRHNFKGNLGAVGNGERGSVSRSIMEYLGRPYRYLNTIGPYDRMAISYGYKGKAPAHKDWFCTDEDQGSDVKSLAVKSPECTKSDATNDPYSFWESRLTRALDLILETKSNSAPVWTTKEVSAQIDEAVIGLSAYALSAKNTSSTWTNFFDKFDRPDTAEGVKPYVLASLKKKICNPTLSSVIMTKEDAEGQKIAQDNLNDLKTLVTARTMSLGLFTADDMKCE